MTNRTTSYSTQDITPELPPVAPQDVPAVAPQPAKPVIERPADDPAVIAARVKFEEITAKRRQGESQRAALSTAASRDQVARNREELAGQYIETGNMPGGLSLTGAQVRIERLRAEDVILAEAERQLAGPLKEAMTAAQARCLAPHLATYKQLYREALKTLLVLRDKVRATYAIVEDLKDAGVDTGGLDVLRFGGFQIEDYSNKVVGKGRTNDFVGANLIEHRFSEARNAGYISATEQATLSIDPE